MTFLTDLKFAAFNIFYFVFYNFIWLFLIGFFFYRTFLLDRLNWALFLVVAALFLIIACRIVSYYRSDITSNIIFRSAALLSLILIISAVFIQIVRFVNVFAPGLAKPTIAVILVRISVLTVIIYVFSLLLTLGCYLYLSQMIDALWDGSIGKVNKIYATPTNRRNLRQIHLFSVAFIRIFFWGGLASFITLIIGFIGWLFRSSNI